MESQETYGSPTEFHGPESLPKCQKSSSRSLHQARDNVEPTSSIQWSAQKNLAEDRKTHRSIGRRKMQTEQIGEEQPTKENPSKEPRHIQKTKKFKKKKKARALHSLRLPTIPYGGFGRLFRSKLWPISRRSKCRISLLGKEFCQQRWLQLPLCGRGNDVV